MVVVYIVPINGEINRATSSFVKNTIEDLEQKNAKAICEINTYGGLIDDAIEIKDTILASKIPHFCLSCNANLLRFNKHNSEKVVMANSATIGSAETIPNTEKIMSMWRAILRDTAQYRDRIINYWSHGW